MVIHPPKGDVYLLVWVDHHDEAMKWAQNKIFEINSETEGLQVIDTAVIATTQSSVEVSKQYVNNVDEDVKEKCYKTSETLHQISVDSSSSTSKLSDRKI